LVNYIREYQIARGVPLAQAYDVTMYILAGLLLVGLLSNLMIRPVAARHFMTDEELASEKLLAHERAAATIIGTAAAVSSAAAVRGQMALVVMAWAAVSIPLMYGVWNTVQKAVLLFR
jgi:hypothetical protein